MRERGANPAITYLPLLTHPDPEVRRQAYIIMNTSLGARAITYVRRLLLDPELHIQSHARRALEFLSDIAEIEIKVEPFRGMYVECLGGLRVFIGSQEIPAEAWRQAGGRAGAHKVQDVFAYLVHCGRNGASKQELSEAVWNIRNSPALSRTLTALRQTLAPADEALANEILAARGDHYTLLTDRYQSDADLFMQTFNEATRLEETRSLELAIPVYEQALRLYGGPYMADVAWGASWPVERRDQFVSYFVITAERIADHAYRHRRFRSCIAVCRQAIDAHATDDRVTVLLLRSYAESRMWPEFERAFQRYVRANGLDLQNLASSRDSVVQTYRKRHPSG